MQVLLFALLMSAAGEQQVISFAGSISGTVFALPTEEPVPGATVVAYQLIQKSNSDSLELKLSKTTITDERGEYRFDSLPAGSYLLRARAPGFYDARTWDVGVSNGVNSRMDLFVQVRDLADYVPGMAPESGTIDGVVHSFIDKPIADVLVTAFSTNTMGPVFQTRTNKKGEFKIEVVWYGRYVVTYSKANFAFGAIGVEVRGRKQVQVKMTQ